MERLVNALIRHLRPAREILEERDAKFNDYQIDDEPVGDDIDEFSDDYEEQEASSETEIKEWQLDQEIILFDQQTSQTDGLSDEYETSIEDLVNRVDSWITQIENALESFAHRHYEQYKRYIGEDSLAIIFDESGELMFSEDAPEKNNEPPGGKKDQGITAFQKFVFIRLLQEVGLFPDRKANTDDAPALKAIALLLGLSYENRIKRGNGTKEKAYKLLREQDRKALTIDQAKNRLKDLGAIRQLAELLNLDNVLTRLDQLQTDLKAIIIG